MRLDQCGGEALVKFGRIMAAGESVRGRAAGDDAYRFDEQSLAGACAAERGAVAEKAGGGLQRWSARCGQQGTEKRTFIQTGGFAWIDDVQPEIGVAHPRCVGKWKCAESVPYTRECRRRFQRARVLRDAEGGNVVAP